MSAGYPLIDIPFDKRHTCWFCAEPCDRQFHYQALAHCPHPSLAVPACKECQLIANKNPLTSIWDCHSAVKDELMQRYAKHLAIGENWTKEELEEADFTCKVFEGFKKSAWFMYEVAKTRVSYVPWPISLNGVLLEDSKYSADFEFDGMHYSSLSKAIAHYAKMLGLDKAFLTELVAAVGRQRFGYAVRVARINIVATQAVKRQVINDILAEKAAD
ncbi:hypothetical protein [Shewanella marisflavi]|uniref:hypothetical protein n=1 Tax=Shewanella marisflavi TaxID=260364 RepID=UPI003AAA2FDC